MCAIIDPQRTSFSLLRPGAPESQNFCITEGRALSTSVR